MKNNKKIPLGSLISTILIGVYMMFSLCAGIGSLFLVRYAGELTTVGMNLATNPGENGDYISGYLILPGSLTAVGLVLLFVIFLILFISSIVMLKKQKIKADACVKIVVCFILSILSWVLFQSAWIVVLLIIPAALGMTELLFDEI